MDYRIAVGILGKLLLAFAFFQTIPLILAIAMQENAWSAFLLSMAISGLVGAGMYYFGQTVGHVGLQEGFLIVSGAWILTSILGGIPYWLTGSVPTYLDALFETVSGLTTTGASVISDVEILPYSILLWRSLTHWLGGMGIIVLFLVFLKNLGADALHLFKAESPGPVVERVMPRIRHMAMTLWKMYVIMTVLLIILLLSAGMNLFDAVNHTFSTMATGGFSTKNTSILYYDSLAIELIIVFFMFVAGGNFGLYFLVWKNGLGRLLRDTEFKVYLGIVAASTGIITFSLVLQNGISWTSGLRDALFTVVSLMTTTGFVTADFDQWPPVAKVLLLLLMVIGGCGGSTAGALKVIRLIILTKDAAASLLQAVHPKIVQAIKLDGRPVDFAVIAATRQFFFLYIFIYLLSVLLVTATGLPPLDSLGAVAAMIGNVGPGFGLVGPTTTFADVHFFAKFVFVLDMLLGRLELVTLLVLFHPGFWQKHAGRRGVSVK